RATAADRAARREIAHRVGVGLAVRATGREHRPGRREERGSGGRDLRPRPPTPDPRHLPCDRRHRRRRLPTPDGHAAPRRPRPHLGRAGPVHPRPARRDPPLPGDRRRGDRPGAPATERGRSLAELYRTPWVAEHFQCLNTEDGRYNINYVFPPLYTEEFLQRFVTNANALQARLDQPLVMENIPGFFDVKASQLPEPV